MTAQKHINKIIEETQQDSKEAALYELGYRAQLQKWSFEELNNWSVPLVGIDRVTFTAGYTDAYRLSVRFAPQGWVNTYAADEAMPF